MNDRWSNNVSIGGGGTPPYVPNFGENGLTIWDFGYPNPSGDSIDDVLNKGLGPLSPQAISGSPLLYTDPQAYFAAMRANNAWPSGDMASGGNGGDPMGDAGIDAVTGAHEFVQLYTPAGSLLAGDPAHAGAVPPAPSLAVPVGVSLQKNLEVGELLNDPFVTDPRDKDAAMLALFSRGGLMDYQRTYGNNGRINPMFIDFGNYNFGAVAAAAGYPYRQVAAAAGLVNLLGGGDKSGPLFNNPRNLSFIRAGYQDYMNGVLRSSP